MKWLFVLVLFNALSALAQDEEAHKSDHKIKGLVKKMHVLGYMVRMVGDSLVYGEKWTDKHYLYNDDSKCERVYHLSENITADTSFDYYSYDKNGKLLGIRRESKNNTLYSFVYVYAGDTLVEEMLQSRNGKARSEHKYIYQGDSVQKLATHDTTGKLNAKDVFRYDKKHNILQKDHYVLGKLYKYIVYEYDVFDNILRSKHYLKGVPDDLYTYEYEYDSHHNFTKRTEYKNGRIYNITTRKIEYQ